MDEIVNEEMDVAEYLDLDNPYTMFDGDDDDEDDGDEEASAVAAEGQGGAKGGGQGGGEGKPKITVQLLKQKWEGWMKNSATAKICRKINVKANAKLAAATFAIGTAVVVGADTVRFILGSPAALVPPDVIGILLLIGAMPILSGVLNLILKLPQVQFLFGKLLETADKATGKG